MSSSHNTEIKLNSRSTPLTICRWLILWTFRIFHYAFTPTSFFFFFYLHCSSKPKDILTFSLTHKTTLGTVSVSSHSASNSLPVRLFQKMLHDHITHWSRLFLELLKQLVCVYISKSSCPKSLGKNVGNVSQGGLLLSVWPRFDCSCSALQWEDLISCLPKSHFCFVLV